MPKFKPIETEPHAHCENKLCKVRIPAKNLTEMNGMKLCWSCTEVLRRGISLENNKLTRRNSSQS